jgi:hypothetical protein
MEILRRVYREGVGREIGKGREKREGDKREGDKRDGVGTEFRRPPEEGK